MTSNTCFPLNNRAPAGIISTETLLNRIHPAYLSSQPQRASSSGSKVTDFQLQQHNLNLNLSLLLACYDSLFLTSTSCLSLAALLHLFFFFLLLLVFLISSPLSLSLPLVTSQPVAPLTEASGLAQAHAMSRTDTSSYLIGCRAERCPHIRAETGGAAIKEGGGEDNKVCDIADT